VLEARHFVPACECPPLIFDLVGAGWVPPLTVARNMPRVSTTRHHLMSNLRTWAASSVITGERSGRPDRRPSVSPALAFLLVTAVEILIDLLGEPEPATPNARAEGSEG
jgi:hypothetical protein